MKYSLASRNALETNFNKVKLFRTTPKDEFSGWVIIGDNEKKELLDESLDQFEVVDNTLVEAYLPDFKAIKDQNEDKLYIHNEGFDRLVEINTEITKYLSNGAFASNQSNLEVDFNQWYRHEKQPLRKHYLWIIFAVLLMPFITIIGGIIIAFQIMKIRSYREEIREYYKMGDTIPGIVTSLNPTTIASLTDLSKGFGRYPVLKVSTYKTKKLSKRKIEVGDKIPMTAIYYTFEGSVSDYWHNVESYPVEFATKNRNKIAEKIYSISILEWNRLEKAISHNKHITKPGLYKIDIESSNWINEPHP